MKLSAQEEYGLRCLLVVARAGGTSVTIPEIAAAEQVSPHNVARYLSILRRGGLVTSERGQYGGYTLACRPDQIRIADVVSALGGPLFDASSCEHFTGAGDTCRRTSVDCAIRGLWMRVQDAVDDVLARTTLQDLLDAADAEAAPVASAVLLQVEGPCPD